MEVHVMSCDDCDVLMVLQEARVEGKLVCCPDAGVTTFGEMKYKCPQCDRVKGFPHKHESFSWAKPRGDEGS